MYAALDAVMKLSIDNPGNRLRFGAGGMCDRVLESLACVVGRSGVVSVGLIQIELRLDICVSY